MLSAEQTQVMKDKLKYVFNDVLYDIRKILSTHFIAVLINMVMAKVVSSVTVVSPATVPSNSLMPIAPASLE